MKINKLRTIDFMGLDGKKEFEFPDKITVLTSPNGSGKTSVLNALRFGLTGDTTKGIMITEGKQKTDVELTFENGCQLIREINTSGSPKQWFNRKAINKRDAERAFEDRMDVSMNAIRVTTASELVGVMKPQELGEFMLRYIPETLDVDTVLSYIPDVTDGMRDYVEANLPETFGVANLDVLYNKAYADRRTAKGKCADDQAILRMYGKAVKPEESLEELQKVLLEVRENEKALAAYRAEKEAYDKSLIAKKRQAETLFKLRASYDLVKDVKYDAEEVRKTKSSIQELQKRIQNEKAGFQSLADAAKALKKAIDTLEQPICPLSGKLVCTTDKSVVRDELMASYKDTCNNGRAYKERWLKLEEELKSLNEKLQILETNFAKASEKTSLEKQIKQAEAALPEMKEPKKPNMPTINETDIRKKIAIWENLQKVEDAKKSLASMSPSVEEFEKLVQALAPKGIVKTSITAAYLSAFEASCNVKANELKAGMAVKFITNNGVMPLLDVHGTGEYLPYAALSGGEKIYLIFILLDMFNQMCGLRMLFLDELSVLDKQNFGILLDVLEKNTDDYDQVFLTTVDHTDLVKELKSRKITMVNVDKV